MKRALLLTGQPGTGKTALIKEALTRTKVKTGGFYTEEIRTGGIRQGFRIVTLDGQEAILAHVSISGSYRVSKYGVDTDGLNRVGVCALRQALEESELIVIDEIGKMELLSRQFSEAVTQAIDSGKKVLGTIMLSPHPFADEIKRHPEVETLLVTRDNRTEAMKRVLDWLGCATNDIGDKLAKHIGNTLSPSRTELAGEGETRKRDEDKSDPEVWDQRRPTRHPCPL